MTTLVYRGGATLTFGDGGRRRTIKFDEQFEVGEQLAKKLLADPTVERYQAPAAAAAVPRETSAEGETHVPTKAELLDRAKRLKLELPTRATKPEIADAIATEEQRLADEAQASDSGEGIQGGSTSANDPDASSSGEADTPPASTGALTLGDLPDSAKVQGS